MEHPLGYIIYLHRYKMIRIEQQCSKRRKVKSLIKVSVYFTNKPEDFYNRGIEKLVEHRRRVIKTNEDCIID